MNFTDRKQANEAYADWMHEAEEEGPDAFRQAGAFLGKHDLYFLLTWIIGHGGFRVEEIDQDWLFERCREVQEEPDGHLDLWAREHFKSTIITFGKTVQDILIDPEITVGIFSHTRPIAKGFLRQIKREFEGNEDLKSFYPEVLYQEPRKESPTWSLDNGIVVKRKSNPKEATVEAWGLVDGQPTSKHFKLLLYDDVVTRESVTTPDQIKKVTGAWELSLNLGAHGGRKRYIGTRYHHNDTYRTMMERGSAKPRIYPATADGKVEGRPVMLTREALNEKRRDMGPYVFGCQMLQNPKADEVQGFKEEWLRFYDMHRFRWNEMNRYLLIDPASEKKKTSDYTVVLVIGLAADRNYYLIDGVRDRLNLTERANLVLRFHRLYRPHRTGYEKYGMQADIEHLQYRMEEENYRFEVIALGGQLGKFDRIRRLIPVCEQGRLWLPTRLLFIDHERKQRDLVREFMDDEYIPFPVCAHDDILDDFARILDGDLGATFPDAEEYGGNEARETTDDEYDI